MSWADKAERAYERAQVPVEGKKHNNHALGNLVWFVLWIILSPLYRVATRGKENVAPFGRGGTGALVVCNHVSFADPIFHYVVLRPGQWPRFMAKDDVMKGFFGWFLGMHGAFPVKRDSADLSAVKRASRYLRDGEIVAMFPEGTRRGRGNVTLRIHAGAALIARMGKAAVVPSTVRNSEKIKPKKGGRIHFPKITVEYGKPLYLKDFEWVEKQSRMEAFSWFAMRECYALNQGIPAVEVNMKELFPLDEDFSGLFGSWRPGDEPPVVKAAAGAQSVAASTQAWEGKQTAAQAESAQPAAQAESGRQ